MILTYYIGLTRDTLVWFSDDKKFKHTEFHIFFYESVKSYSVFDLKQNILIYHSLFFLEHII